jgi:hypothetical protein
VDADEILEGCGVTNDEAATGARTLLGDYASVEQRTEGPEQRAAARGLRHGLLAEQVLELHQYVFLGGHGFA